MTMPFPPSRPGPTIDALRRLQDEQRRKAEALAKRRLGLPMDSEELPILDPTFTNTMLPTMRVTAEAPQAAEAGAARLMMPDAATLPPAVLRRVPGLGESLVDVAKQVPRASAGLAARMGEGTARTIGSWLPDGSKGAQALANAGDRLVEANRRAQEQLAPRTALGKMASPVAEIGVSALPYVAAGGGLLGLLRSAALTGIESRAKDGSLVEGLANITGSEALRNLADSKYRTGTDVAVDMATNMIPGLGAFGDAIGRNVDTATQGLTGLERMRAGAQQVGTNAGTMARAGLQELRSNPWQTAATLGAIGGEAFAPGASAPFFMGSVMPVGRPNLDGTAKELLGETVMPVEALPGSKWEAPTAAGIAQAFPRTRAMYAQEQLPTIKPMLVELDKHFGLPKEQQFAEADINWGVGSYEGQANVNAQVVLPAQVPHVEMTPKLDKNGQPVLAKNGEPIMVEKRIVRPPSKLEKDAIALALAISQRQNAVPWMTPTPVPGGQRVVQQLATLPADAAFERATQQGLPDTGLVIIPIPKAMNAGQAEHIAQVLQSANLPHSFTQVKSATGSYLVFGNFTRWLDAPVSDAQMLREVAGALNGDEIWEKVAPGDIQPFYARSYGNYLGDSNEATHLEQLRELIEQSDPQKYPVKDASAASLARRLADFLDRNADSVRSGQEQVDRAYQPAAVFDRGIADELRAGGVAPQPGLVAPYNARGLHPSLLERGDPNVPLLTAEGKPTPATVTLGTTVKNADTQLAALDRAFEQYPNPMLDPDQYKQWGSQLFGPVIPRRPTLPLELAQNVETLAPLLRRLDDQTTLGPAQMRSKMGSEADEGLQMGQQFTEAYTTGTANPVTSLMLYSWGNLSKQAAVAPHETAFLDLVFSQNRGEFEDILSRVASGAYTDADAQRIRAIGDALPAGAFDRQVIKNFNALAESLKKMSQPVANARAIPTPDGGVRPETKAERWHALLADRSLTDEQYLREFQRAFGGEGVGMDNKVVSFIGLVAGRPGLIVPDRVQLGLQHGSKTDFKGTSLESNIYDNAGLSDLYTGVQGVAMQEAIQRGLSPSLEKLSRAINKPGALNIGNLHWYTWVAQSDQEVGHGSLDVILGHAQGKGTPGTRALVKEGQLDKFRYGEFQGVLNGERVFGHTTSDGKMYVMPREVYNAIGKMNKEIAPKTLAISQNTQGPYWNAPGYPREERDALIKQYGIEVPPPSNEAVVRGTLEQLNQADQNAMLSQLAKGQADRKAALAAQQKADAAAARATKKADAQAQKQAARQTTAGTSPAPVQPFASAKARNLRDPK